MGMKKRLKPYEDAVRDLGGDVIEVKPTSAHFALVYTYEGKTRTTTIPNSPGDKRAFLNWKSDVKRQIREIHDGK